MLPAAGADREPPAYLHETTRFLCGTRFEDLDPGDCGTGSALPCGCRREYHFDR
jgi:hypothetical protein